MPFTPIEVRALLTAVLTSDDGEIVYTVHALERMNERNVDQVDVYTTLSRGAVPDRNYARLERGTWRYRVSRRDTTVVVSFDEETKAIIVTVLR